MLTLKKDAATLNNIVADMSAYVHGVEADEPFLLWSRSIVANAPFAQFDQLSAILAFVRANVNYQPDPVGTELFTTPQRMMERIQAGQLDDTNKAFGDCDCIAILCTAICRTLGYNSWIVLLDQTGNGYNHAACEVYSEETLLTYYMDPTIPNNPLSPASPGKDNEPAHQYTPGYIHKLEVH